MIMIHHFKNATGATTARIEPSLFIFDLNGTLFDTEFDIATLTSRLAKEKGLKITPEIAFQRLSGRDIGEKFNLIAMMNDKTLSPGKLQTLCREHEAGVEALVDNPRLPLVFGAKDLLAGLKREGHVLAACTNTAQNLAIAGLKHTRLLDFFEDRVFTPDMVAGRKKPDSALYDLILKDLRTAPPGAYAVEDSIAGVSAAKDAHISTFAYADPRYGRKIDQQRRALERAGAAITVENLIDIHTLLFARTIQFRRPNPGFTLD